MFISCNTIAILCRPTKPKIKGGKDGAGLEQFIFKVKYIIFVPIEPGEKKLGSAWNLIRAWLSEDVKAFL